VSDLRELLGLAVIPAFAFAVSNNRGRVPDRRGEVAQVVAP
jgi:hypothetical protein